MTKNEQKRVECAETRRTLHTHTHTGSLCLAFILSILTFPTFSETLGNSPQCDNNTLHTTTGPATLNARWTANTIILNWQPGNDATFTAPAQNDAAYSCEYDGGITLPTAPTRSGYTFGGWRVAQSFDLSTLSNSINTNGIYYIAKGYYNNAPYCEGWDASNEQDEYEGWFGMDEENADCSDNRFSDLSVHEWVVTFSYGTVKGEALCATNNGTYATPGTPVGTGGRYCWCRASGFAGTGSNTYQSVSSPSWVFNDDYGNADNCARDCARDCAGRVNNFSAFRRAVFGVTQ